MKLTAEEKAENVIEWIDRLDNFSKTAGQLGEQNDNGRWSYCCLGVGCRINRLRTEYTDGTSHELARMMGMTDDIGALRHSSRPGGMMEVEITDYDGRVIRDFSIFSLVDANDDAFQGETNFKRMKQFMLLTLKYWLKPSVYPIVRDHFKEEISALKKSDKAIKVKFRKEQSSFGNN